MLIDVRGRVTAGIAARRTKAQIVAGKPAARHPRPDGFINADKFVEAVYDSLRAPPRPVSPREAAPHKH